MSYFNDCPEDYEQIVRLGVVDFVCDNYPQWKTPKPTEKTISMYLDGLMEDEIGKQIVRFLENQASKYINEREREYWGGIG